MQLQAGAVARASQTGFRHLKGALRGAPIFPVVIVALLAIFAIFGNVLVNALPTKVDNCPADACLKNPDNYNPEAGNLGEKHYPPIGIKGVVRGATGETLFIVPFEGFEEDLNNEILSPAFLEQFEAQGVTLPEETIVNAAAPGLEWLLEGTKYVAKGESAGFSISLADNPEVFPALSANTLPPAVLAGFAENNIEIPDDAELVNVFPGFEWTIENTPYKITAAAGEVAVEANQIRVAIAQIKGDKHHILGTDRLGRDVLARLIMGGRKSLTIAAISILISSALGTSLGLIAGYYGRYVDALLMRLVDLSLAFPAILLALVFAVAFGPNEWWVVVVLVMIRWAHFARLARGETLALKERDFVALARVAGAPVWRIIGIHIFPNLVNSIVVLATLHIGSAIIVEATLSFLGAGVPPPIPTWGEMIAGDRQFVRTAWWVSVSAGVAIALTVLSFNLLGDWLRDRLDPGLRTL
jgi:peptide/nickel transport system permease protein